MSRVMTLKIYFENQQDKLPVTYKLKMLMRRAIEATLDYEQYGNPCEVSLTFTDNQQIRELNKKFRGIDRATDVLSFPLFDYDEDNCEPPINEIMNNAGDIVISLERAKEQADEFGHSFEREAAFLCVHSMLHLLGYDHVNSDEEDVEMREHQRVIMTHIGLERPKELF